MARRISSEPIACPRVSDLNAMLASTSGKIELETVGEASEEKILGKLAQKAVLSVFNRAFSGADLEEVAAAFQGGRKVDVSDVMPSDTHVRQIGEARPVHAACKKLGAKDPATAASTLEFVLEGLHLSR
jgi:magnesium chelatase subunit I